MKGLFVTSSSAALTGTTYQKVSLTPIGAIIFAVCVCVCVGGGGWSVDVHVFSLTLCAPNPMCVDTVMNTTCMLHCLCTISHLISLKGIPLNPVTAITKHQCKSCALFIRSSTQLSKLILYTLSLFFRVYISPYI